MNQTLDISSIKDNLDVIYKCLYLPRLTDYLTSLVSAYIEAYHVLLAQALSSEHPDPNTIQMLELLSGPINEIYNPNNPKMQEGKRYPAIDIIMGKEQEYSSGLEKSFSRKLKNPNAPSIDNNEDLDLNNSGFLDVFFIIGIVILSGIFLAYVFFLLN